MFRQNPLENELPSYTIIQVIMNYCTSNQKTNKIYILKHHKKISSRNLLPYLDCFDDELYCLDILDSAVHQLSDIVLKELTTTYQLNLSDLVISINKQKPYFYICKNPNSVNPFQQIELTFPEKLLLFSRIEEYKELAFYWEEFDFI